MKASVATNVTVDLEDFDCNVCFAPLKPPVFQCASGHILCSICYEKLPGKEKCQVCSITIGYNRCFAMERVLQSIQVLCSNARNGCTARMPYHEMEEHEKECPKAGCGFAGSKAMQPMPLHQGILTDCITPVCLPCSVGNIPQMQDSAVLDFPRCLHPLVPLVYQCTAGHVVCSSLQSMRLACPNAIDRCTGLGSIAGNFVKMGPCGGRGGDTWEMNMDGVNRIIKLHLWHDIMVDAMMVMYEHDDGMAQIKQWGFPQAANCSEVCLEEDEYLTAVKGHADNCKGWLRVRSLTLISNQRIFGPYGTEEGVPFELPAAGGRIIGFHGRSGNFLDAIGTYVKMDA
uniref:Uncharacterized protein n=1 Tax=Avena sativa TaxID=4498 RepID=A0ACD5TSV4_AVESA